MSELRQKKINIVALFGKSGAGKDALLKSIASWLPVQDSVHVIVSCTTRSPRDKEVDGVDYHFLTHEDFLEKIMSGEMLEAAEFNSWFYGTELSALNPDKINIGVFNIEGVENLLQDSRLEVLPIYVSVDDKTRLIRALNREARPDCHEICRRFLADEMDFVEYDFEAIELSNSDDLKETTRKLGKIIEALIKVNEISNWVDKIK